MFGCFTCLPNWLTFTCVSITVFMSYVGFLTVTMSSVLIPGGLTGFTIEPHTQLYKPFWKQGQRLETKIYLSLRQAPVSARELQTMPSLQYFSNLHHHQNQSKKDNKRLFGGSSVLLWKQKGVTFDWLNTSHATQTVNLTESNTPPKLWKMALSGKPLYVHAYVGHESRKMTDVRDYKFVLARTTTTKKVTKKAVPPTWRLHPAFCNICGDANASTGPPAVLPASAIRNAPPKPHWKPRAAFRFVVDFTEFPTNQIPPLMQPHFRLTPRRQYLPFSFADEVGLTTDQLIALNQTVTLLPLEIEVGPSSLGRWQLGAMMDQSISIMHNSMGAEEKDSDELRYMLTETHPYVLMLTLCVSLLHTLFDVLAFKSDIQFWNELKTLRGLSTRAVVTSLICQIVVVAYLHHQETSKLVLVPAAFGVVLQFWKVWKV